MQSVQGAFELVGQKFGVDTMFEAAIVGDQFGEGLTGAAALLAEFVVLALEVADFADDDDFFTLERAFGDQVGEDLADELFAEAVGVVAAGINDVDSRGKGETQGAFVDRLT